MDNSKKPTIKRYLVCIAAFQIIFLSELIYFHDILIVPNSFFYKLTFEEWNWLVQQGTKPHQGEIIIFSEMLQDVFIVIFIVGICRLFWVKQNILPIRTLWKIIIPVIGIALYIPCFYYFKYKVEHYRLYMSSVPAEIVSLVLLCLILVGLERKRAAEGNYPK